MKVAIPEFNGRVSPIFDNSQRLLVFDIGENGSRQEVSVDWSGVSRPYRGFDLRKLGVNVLICGGISCWLADQVELQDIQLVPWIAGEVYEVLDAFLGGRLPGPRYFMPGCRGMGRGRRGFRGGRGRNRRGGRGRGHGGRNFY